MNPPANRAILVMVATDSAAGTTTVTNGTDTFSAISGADVTQGTIHLLAFGAITSLTGAQTITITPQNTGHPLQAGVLTFSGVDQTTPFNNGNATSNTGASPISLAVTSVNGDLTSSAIAQDGPGAGSVTTNQTSRYTNSAAAGLGGDTGPGTGNTTHTWTDTAFAWTNAALIGVNVKQVSGTADTPRTPTVGAQTLTGVAGSLVKGNVLTPITP